MLKRKRLSALVWFKYTSIILCSIWGADILLWLKLISLKSIKILQIVDKTGLIHPVQNDLVKICFLFVCRFYHFLFYPTLEILEFLKMCFSDKTGSPSYLARLCHIRSTFFVSSSNKMNRLLIITIFEWLRTNIEIKSYWKNK